MKSQSILPPLAAAFQGIPQQAGNGHGSHASGNWRDEAGLWGSFLKGDIADEAGFAILHDAVDADIDDDGIPA